ncbi:hypothetical protein SBA4_1300005 [Candidatus Sulfopaludibacter sp. SbA4]|nr:hypothetical protein SBA4_1300005 [Candidatus Sulfopaludibacter sp. SbA4]
MPTEPQEFAALRKLATSRDAGRIDRQAQKLADPIERLQYLRQATAAAGYVPARPRWRPAAAFLLLAAVSLRSDANVHRQPGIRPAASLHLGSFDVPNVWIVEETKDYETYSNGLRIETELAVSNQPRSWPLLGRDSVGVDGPLRSQPAGIVFHTTESQQAPFEASYSTPPRANRRPLKPARNTICSASAKSCFCSCAASAPTTTSSIVSAAFTASWPNPMPPTTPAIPCGPTRAGCIST